MGNRSDTVNLIFRLEFFSSLFFFFFVFFLFLLFKKFFFFSLFFFFFFFFFCFTPISWEQNIAAVEHHRAVRRNHVRIGVHEGRPATGPASRLVGERYCSAMEIREGDGEVVPGRTRRASFWRSSTRCGRRGSAACRICVGKLRARISGGSTVSTIRRPSEGI